MIQGKDSRWIYFTIAIVVVAYTLYRSGQREGELNQQITDLIHQNDSLAILADHIQVVYVKQTDTLRIVRHRTDSLLQTDTVFSVDTVRQIVETERKACDTLLLTCEQQKANLRAQVANIQQQLIIERKRHPSRFGCVGGAAVTPKGVGPGAACGIRF